MSLDNQSALRQQQTPYAHPPHSAHSTSGSLPSALASPSSTVASSKKAASSSASARIKNELQEKLSKFTRESEGRMDDEDDQRTRRLVARLNYTVRNQELNLRRDELASKKADDELAHRCEIDCMDKDIQLKRTEESCIDKQMQMLQLQI